MMYLFQKSDFIIKEQQKQLNDLKNERGNERFNLKEKENKITLIGVLVKCGEGNLLGNF